MTYTNHGHHIPGTPLGDIPAEFLRCGGVMRCPKCREESKKYSVDQPLAAQVKAQWMVMEHIDAVFIEKFGAEVQKPSYVVNIVGFSRFGRSWQAYAETSIDDGLFFSLSFDDALEQYDIQVFSKTTARTILE